MRRWILTALVLSFLAAAAAGDKVYTRDGKICIICVPEKDKFAFDFSWGNSEIIKLENETSHG